MNNAVQTDAFVEALESHGVDALDDRHESVGYMANGRSSRCWVCNSQNSRLVLSRGYGIVHECVDCGDRFPEDGAIQWPM